jgi:hypothetical protein
VISLSGPWITATLAWVPPLKVQVLAWPAIPISWSAHLPFSKIPNQSVIALRRCMLQFL